MEIVENQLIEKTKTGNIEIKELNQFVKAAAHISDLQDRTMVVMKIDPSVDKEYQENANAIENVLNAADVPDEEKQFLKDEIEEIHAAQTEEIDTTKIGD